jgi:gliding-associated putative ABC transporter substrate-binding component GldG
MKARHVHSVLVVIITALAVWLAVQVAGRYRIRWDLTEEQRYSVSEASKATLNQLDEEVFVEVYLAGELPPQFQRFQNAIRDLLDVFSVYADVQFRFVDPAAASNAEARQRYFQSLMQKGIQPTNLNYRQDGQSSQKLIFPGATVSVGAREVAVNLLSGNKTASKEEVINESIEALEYEFVQAIRNLTEARKRIGLVTGHGEPDSLQLAGLIGRITEKFDLFKIPLSGRRQALKGYDAILLTKPTIAFSEAEKYLLDQYVMRGGNLLIFYDALRVNMDSASGEGTIAVPYEVNLDDLLFKYGIRINRDYVLDLNCGTFPVVTGNFGEQPQIQSLPWPFFPVITHYGDHPSVKGMDAVLMRFASSLDTVKAVGVEKTPLLQTTERSKIMGPPVRVAFNDLYGPLQPEYFQEGTVNLGYLLEGRFTSLYKNRFLPKGFDKEDFIEQGIAARVVVMGDGDMIRNELDLENGQPLDLGVDPYSGVQYGNGELITRLLEFLTDDDGLIMVKAKEIKIRPLDKVRVAEERTRWQFINVAMPLVVILMLGLGKYYIRRKKFTD